MADKGKYYSTRFAMVVPDKGVKQTTTTYANSKQGVQSCYSQTTTTVKDYDKNTGSHARATNREIFSSGDTFKERSTGRVGYKDEYKKTTNTYTVGDKTGFTEYMVEERVRNVSYGGGSSKGYNGSNKYLK